MSWKLQPVCVCARVCTPMSSALPLHLWFLVVSFRTPVDPADTMLHPGDPPRQEAQLKPAWIPDPRGCKAVNAWSLMSPGLLCSTVTDNLLCAPCRKQAELGLNGLQGPLWEGPRLAACLWSLVQLHGYRGSWVTKTDQGSQQGPLSAESAAGGPGSSHVWRGEEAPGSGQLVSGPAGGATPSPAGPDLKASSQLCCARSPPVSWRHTRMGPWPRTGNQSQQTATAYREAFQGVAAAPGVSPTTLALPGR